MILRASNSSISPSVMPTRMTCPKRCEEAKVGQHGICLQNLGCANVFLIFFCSIFNLWRTVRTGYLEQWPLREPNADTKGAATTIANMVNILTDADASAKFRTAQEQIGVDPSRLDDGTPAQIYNYKTSSVMKEMLKTSHRRTTHVKGKVHMETAVDRNSLKQCRWLTHSELDLFSLCICDCSTWNLWPCCQSRMPLLLHTGRSHICGLPGTLVSDGWDLHIP